MFPKTNKIEVKEVACSLCGLNNAAHNITVKDYLTPSSDQNFRYIFCRCGVIYLLNQPLESELTKLYPNTYGAHLDRPGVVSYFKGVRFRRIHKGNLKKFSEPSGKNRVLDFGCGGGEFLEAVSRLKNTETWGYEFSSNDSLQNKKSIRAIYDYTDLLMQKPFDSIYMYQVIEHLPDPRLVLVDMKKIASKSCRLVIETPSFSGLLLKLFPTRFWGGWHAPRHFIIFQEQTLIRTLNEAGWKVEDIRYVPSPFQWAETFRPILRKIGIRNLNLSNPVATTIFYLIDRISIFFGFRSSNLHVTATLDDQSFEKF